MTIAPTAPGASRIPISMNAVSANVPTTPIAARRHRSAALIDWEHAGVGPRYSDAIRFLTTLSRDEDAEYALECILGQAPSSDREMIGVQLRWLSLRHYADQITAEESAVSLQHREHIRQRWQQAMTWAAEIAPEPDQSAGTD